MQLQFHNIINDELRGSETTHKVTDPRTEEPLWPCPVASTQDFEDAVAAAQDAFKTWGRTTVPERQALLVKLAENLQEHAEELTEILRKETGKSASSPTRLCRQMPSSLFETGWRGRGPKRKIERKKPGYEMDW